MLENQYNNVQAAAATNGKSNRRIVGWKAIGQFLGCTERTARRWQRRALPVHRVPGGSRSSVWADPDELTAWLRDLPSELQADLRAEAGALPAASAAQSQPADSTRQRRWKMPAVALLLVTLTVAALAIRTLSQRHPLRAAAPAHTPYDDNPQARETYTTGRFELSMRSADSLGAAEKNFRQLVDRYPQRAAGWSGLADTYLLQREFGAARGHGP